MRDELGEWYPLNLEERQRVLENGAIVFDTSSLLALYRFSLGDRTQILSMMEAVKERIWIPFRVAEEYQKNRLSVFRKQLAEYDDLLGEIRKLNQKVSSIRSHPVLSQRAVMTEIGDRLSGIERYVNEQKAMFHPEDLTDPMDRDGVRDALDAILSGRIGGRIEITDGLLAIARDRMAKRIPPGFQDKAKPEPDCFGDFFIWNATLDEFKSDGSVTTPLLFVTEEQKTDWWLVDESNQNRILPHPELVREARSAGVTPFLMVGIKRFFENMASQLNWAETVLGEVAPVPSGDESGIAVSDTPDDLTPLFQ